MLSFKYSCGTTLKNNEKENKKIQKIQMKIEPTL